MNDTFDDISEKPQLDLLDDISEAPQANNLGTLLALIDQLHKGTYELNAIAEAMEVDPRTARYYADFARWLGLATLEGGGEWGLSNEGQRFALSPPARPRIFANALFSRQLVRTVHQLKRAELADHPEPAATREACRRAIAAHTTLAAATVDRRASALAAMLGYAYNRQDFDWTTGQPLPQSHAALSFEGQSFLSAFSARKFSSRTAIQVGLPAQLLLYLRGEPLPQKRWQRASYDVPDQPARWFGSIPLNPTTLALASKKSPELATLIVTCNPYVAMIMAMLTCCDRAGRHLFTLTDDMYGVRLWWRGRELGPLIDALNELALALDLHPADHVPHCRDQADDCRTLKAHELLEVLQRARLVRHGDTALVAREGLLDRWRNAPDDAPSLTERLTELRDAILQTLNAPAHG
ncbi:hypothetical protein FRC96_17660 [Lujinxingia vulgaris]|uniref:Uncharacterized protein n=1 Tax=Lujinxingia vulgaris TaxID=2600176 RepID=A0A5C6X132_9DELT|nr:hypothetical protein [Lujinxingia vulgaris]TXD32383.1 hypothetical protein FRC96_17660 [Lujinxingia vulgaris]